MKESLYWETEKPELSGSEIMRWGQRIVKVDKWHGMSLVEKIELPILPSVRIAELGQRLLKISDDSFSHPEPYGILSEGGRCVQVFLYGSRRRSSESTTAMRSVIWRDALMCEVRSTPNKIQREESGRLLPLIRGGCNRFRKRKLSQEKETVKLVESFSSPGANLVGIDTRYSLGNCSIGSI
jgi:hypothetical protein